MDLYFSVCNMSECYFVLRFTGTYIFLVCDMGQFCMSTMTCVNCGGGTYMDEVNHTLPACKDCSCGSCKYLFSFYWKHLTQFILFWSRKFQRKMMDLQQQIVHSQFCYANEQ